ncbi:TetR/AcrR family transcriptional regulator [Nocardia cyriacigeorgica]|uniref:TetR/AcrR family transcriptional regulator n=1 Tax=Nocardia cyriacigeorgica TaxID=135487 RepID=UPI001895D019|nr:TetR/AcrR family transcriptional regulator [Nocardia cyriacigeorgica]MBF6323273.1 TetR/AcrR family transcriptional regulator [Nocardia cyriacigeorgica]
MDQQGREVDEQTQPTPGPRRRTGGRSARVRHAVLTATLEQVAEHGIEGLTIGDVAARAGVAETTIYRRWGTRTALIAAAVTEMAAAGNPLPDTGALRTDLQVLAEQITHLIELPGVTRLVGTTMALSADPEVDAARRRFWSDRFELSSQVISKAIERGELPQDTDPRAVLETLSAPLYFRIIVGDRPIDGPFIARCIEDTLTLHGHSR